MANFFVRKSLMVILGMGTLILTGCQGLDVKTDGTTWSGRGWSRSATTDVTAVVSQKGEGKGQKVTISRGYVEFDRYSEVAYHITVGRQTKMFSSRDDQGGKGDNSIEFSAKGARGTANVAIGYSFTEADESVGEFLRTYKMDDTTFGDTIFRQAVQQEMLRVMRNYDPVMAIEKQDEIAGLLKEALQKRFGKMLVINDLGFTDQFSFSKDVMAAIGQASQAKAQESAVQAKIKLLQAEGALRDEQVKAFKQVPQDQRRFEIEKMMVERGLNPYQPTLVAPASAPSK